VCGDVFLCNLFTPNPKDYALLILVSGGHTLGKVKSSNAGYQLEKDFLAN